MRQVGKSDGWFEVCQKLWLAQRPSRARWTFAIVRIVRRWFEGRKAGELCRPAWRSSSRSRPVQWKGRGTCTLEPRVDEQASDTRMGVGGWLPVRGTARRIRQAPSGSGKTSGQICFFGCLRRAGQALESRRRWKLGKATGCQKRSFRQLEEGLAGGISRHAISDEQQGGTEHF